MPAGHSELSEAPVPQHAQSALAVFASVSHTDLRGWQKRWHTSFHPGIRQQLSFTVPFPQQAARLHWGHPVPLRADKPLWAPWAALPTAGAAQGQGSRAGLSRGVQIKHVPLQQLLGHAALEWPLQLGHKTEPMCVKTLENSSKQHQNFNLTLAPSCCSLILF